MPPKKSVYAKVIDNDSDDEQDSSSSARLGQIVSRDSDFTVSQPFNNLGVSRVSGNPGSGALNSFDPGGILRYMLQYIPSITSLGLGSIYTTAKDSNLDPQQTQHMVSTSVLQNTERNKVISTERSTMINAVKDLAIEQLRTNKDLQIARINSEATRYAAEVQAEATKYAAQVNALALKYQADKENETKIILQSMHEKHEQQMLVIKNSHETELRAIDNAYNKEIEEIQNKHMLEMDKQKEQGEVNKRNHEKEMEQLKANIEKSKSEWEQERNRIISENDLAIKLKKAQIDKEIAEINRGAKLKADPKLAVTELTEYLKTLKANGALNFNDEGRKHKFLQETAEQYHVNIALVESIFNSISEASRHQQPLSMTDPYHDVFSSCNEGRTGIDVPRDINEDSPQERKFKLECADKVRYTEICEIAKKYKISDEVRDRFLSTKDKHTPQEAKKLAKELIKECVNEGVSVVNEKIMKEAKLLGYYGADNLEMINLALLRYHEQMALEGSISFEYNDVDIGIINKYWGKYTLEGITEVLNARLHDVHLDDVEILKGIFVNTQSNNISYLLEDIIKSSVNTILVPLNLFDKHAVGLVFQKQGGDGMDLKLKVTYMDPSNEKMPQELKYSLYFGLKQIVPDIEVIVEELGLEPQKYANCGPEVIENFVYYLGGDRATQEEAIELHSVLMAEKLTDESFNREKDLLEAFDLQSLFSNEDFSLSIVGVSDGI